MSQKVYHKNLSYYFQSKPLYVDEPTQKKPNIRKLIELPWQETQGRMWRKLEHLLSNLEFLETKIVSGNAFDLLKDFQFALQKIPLYHLYLPILSKFYDAIKKDIIFIDEYKNSYPQAIFQCLWNSCWGCDNQDLNQDSVKISKNIKGQKQESFQKANTPKLNRILENWRKDREAKYPGFLWIRNLIPDVQRLAQYSSTTNFMWHNGTVYDIAISSGNNVLVSCSADTTICIWDINSEFPPKVLSGHTDIVVKVSISKNGEIAVSASKDNTIRIWNIRDLKEIGRIPNLTIQDYYGLSLSEDANYAAIVSTSAKKLEIFKIDNRELFKSLPVFDVHQSIVLGRICFSAGNEFIGCCGSSDSLISVWEIKTGKLYAIIDCAEDDIEDMAFLRNRKQLISCSINGKIKLWDFKCDSKLKPNDYKISADLKRSATRIAISHDDKTIGIVSNENIIICNTADFEIQSIISKHDDDIETIIFDRSNKFVLTGGQDKTILINGYAEFDEKKSEEKEVIKYQNLLISKNRKTLVASSNIGLFLLNPSDLTPILKFNLPTDCEPNNTIEAISGDGQIIGVFCNGDLTLCNVISGDVVATIKTKIGKSRRSKISISHDGSIILLVCDSIGLNNFRKTQKKCQSVRNNEYSHEDNIFMWKKVLNGWKLDKSFSLGSDCIVSGITLSENGEMWAISYYKISGNIETLISIWTDDRNVNPTIINTTNSVSKLEFGLGNKIMAGLQDDLLRGKMFIWDTETGEVLMERIGSGDISFFCDCLNSHLFMSVKLAHETIFADIIRKIRIAVVNDSMLNMVQGKTERYCFGIKQGDLYGLYLEGDISRNENYL